MSRFATTFLGHQGWLIRSTRSCLLVDPLLCEQFGEIHALDYRVYPPRLLSAEAFPAIDAVILSHEHDDHFDIPSLARLDRRIPIFLSAHSSIAAFRILSEIGFVVRPLVPGVPLEIGDLHVVPFSGDHVSVNCADEWDALPFLIYEGGGAGSLFSMVDVALLPTHVEWAKAYVARPGLVTWSNNALDWSHMGEHPARDVGTEQCFMSMGNGHKLISTSWGTPSAMLMCAGGFAFYGDRAWLNERVFWVDTAAVCHRLGGLYKDERFFSTLPGQTFSLEENRLVKVEVSTPFLSVAPRAQWPTRNRRARSDAHDYTPATGRVHLADGDDERLQESLNELAAALVGGILFRSLHSILATEAAGRKPTFALVLRHGTQGATRVFEYSASACTFVPVAAENPRSVYLAGWECWATDLLAVLRGDIGPITLMFGRARLWNALPQRFRFDLLEGLTCVSHPLRRPSDYLRIYQRIWEKSKRVTPTIRANVADSSIAGTNASQLLAG